MAIGFTLPFSITTGSIGFFETTPSPLAATQENLKSLLLTNWGERVNHFRMGCNLKEFLFENFSSEEIKSRIGERIVSQVETWLPFVGIRTLNILTTEDDSSINENAIRIKITFYLLSSPDLSSKLDIQIAQ